MYSRFKNEEKSKKEEKETERAPTTRIQNPLLDATQLRCHHPEDNSNVVKECNRP